MTVAELIAELERVRDKTMLVAVKQAGEHLIKSVPVEDKVEVVHLARATCVVLTAGTWPEG